MESATENNRHSLTQRMVRVKTGGKSTRYGNANYHYGQTLPGARQNRHVWSFVPVKRAGMSLR